MELSWIFYLSLLVGFIFAFGIGANDVANSFGTSIGSGALTMGRAVSIAAVCELTGAITLGAGVSDTIIRQISDLDTQSCWDCGGARSKMPVFMLGMTCALVAGAGFMLLATWAAMPVSTTHAIVGAVLGMSLVGAGASCVRWGYPGLLTIVASWLWSPLAAGMASGLCLVAVKHCVLEAPRAEQRALVALPLLFGATMGIVLVLVLLRLPLTAAWPAWQLSLAPVVTALGIAALVQVLLVPVVRARLSAQSLAAPKGSPGAAGGGKGLERPWLASLGAASEVEMVEGKEGEVQGNGRRGSMQFPLHALPSLPPEGSALEEADEELELLPHARRTATDQDNDAFWEDDSLSGPGAKPSAAPEQGPAGDAWQPVDSGAVDDPGARPSEGPGPPENAERVFMYLQVLSACLKSFAHGANDTANAAGPFAAVQALYLHGLNDCTSVSTPIWVLAFCGAGIVLGLATCGYRVMNTVGKDITDINFSRGFAIELGSTLSVVIASVVGMPVSSTHCQIGSIVAVGLLESGPSSVRWGVFKNILLAWLVTVPVAALAAGLLLLALRPTVA